MEVAEDGWDRAGGPCQHGKEFALYSGGSGESVNGLGEGSDLQIPF